MYDVHCPNCGEFRVQVSGGALKACPRCESDQIITLPHSYDIDLRFKLERLEHRTAE